MKRTIALLATLSAGAFIAPAQSIDSTVIHNYKQVSVGYGYLHDVGNSGINFHGVVAGASYDVKNVLFAVDGGYLFGDDDLGIDADIDTWQVRGTVGYIFRLMENHVNVIPNIGVGYSEVNIRTDFGDADSDATTLQPGVILSYAINNSLSVNAGYTYGFDVEDTDDDAHAFTVGGTVKLAEHVGLSTTAEFIEDYGFSALTARISYHF